MPAYNVDTTAITTNRAGSGPDGVLLLGSPVSLVAAGSTNADAPLITSALTLATGGNGSKGVKLPTIAAAGQVCMVCVNGDGDVLIYPGTSQSINGGTATTGAVTAEDDLPHLFVASSLTNWAAMFTAG